MADRPGRSTARRPNQGPVDPAVDRRAQPCARLADTRDGRPAGQPYQRAVLSVLFGRPGGRPSVANGQNVTVGRSTERLTGRSFLAVSAANGYIFLGAINTPLERVFSKNFCANFFLLSGVFTAIKRSFWT